MKLLQWMIPGIGPVSWLQAPVSLCSVRQAGGTGILLGGRMKYHADKWIMDAQEKIAIDYAWL
ncbi:hypothetical protein [Chitinophaga sp. Ak27]|uniref:hypothetical protein n=1 Tax=Chitinophaga sp. Ak27 TaxID=2726116 RepID=UPI00145F8FF1|nr:hypothetical protein [Chitinophaga sp. Ak27]NLU90482.1 hypothetical protein [Chitinophaga sp. Ak27]